MATLPLFIYIEPVQKPRWLIALMLIMAVVLPMAVFSQNPKPIVVLPFTGGGLSKAELLDLTLVFEESLSGVSSLRVIDQSQREKVLLYLDPELLTCVDVGCAVRIGKALSAATVVIGAVVADSGKYAVSLRVITVATGGSLKADSATVSSATELPQVLRMLASELFAAPLSDSRAGKELTAAEVEEKRLDALESMRANLMASIAEIRKQKAATQAWGWTLLGVGAVSAGLSAACYYLAGEAYDLWKSTGDPDLQARVTLLDTLTLVSAGASAVSIGCSIPLFARGPSSRAEKQQLRQIEADINALRNAQQETP